MHVILSFLCRAFSARYFLPSRDYRFSPFFLSPPRHAGGPREVLTVVCLMIAPAFSFNCISSRFSWLHSLAVQGCGSGFWGAASSTHNLVSGIGISPYFPYISAYAAYQGGLALWYGLQRPVTTSKQVSNWSVFVLLARLFVFGIIMR